MRSHFNPQNICMDTWIEVNADGNLGAWFKVQPRAHKSFWFSQLPPCFFLSDISISMEGFPLPCFLFIL